MPNTFFHGGLKMLVTTLGQCYVIFFENAVLNLTIQSSNIWKLLQFGLNAWVVP